MGSIRKENLYTSFQIKQKRRVDINLGELVRKHRPNWNSTNSSILCSDHFEESCFTINRAIAMELGMKTRLKADAIPTTDLSSVEKDEAGKKPLTQRAQRQVSHPCLLSVSQTFKVGTNISAKLFLNFPDIFSEIILISHQYYPIFV